MSFADPPEFSGSLYNEQSFMLRLWTFIVDRCRPAFGWSILFCALLLAWLPMQAASANEWIILGSYSNTLAPVGPLGVLLIWWIMAWKQDSDQHLLSNRSRLWLIGMATLVVVVGLVIITQALVGWIPGPIRLVRGLVADGGAALVSEMSADLSGYGERILRWWGGVQAGGATQDDIVFASFAGLLAWFNGILMGYLIRRGYGGLLSSLPSLWLLMSTLLYGSAGRMFFVGGLLVALLLHVLLDQRRLDQIWEASGISYGEGLIVDRLLAVLAAAAIVFALATFTPNISLDRLATRYFQLYRPINDQVEDFGQRLFPDLKATSRFRGSALSTGLPNSFLLGAGPELSQTEVMRYRTDEDFAFEPDILEEVPVMGHYIRGGTLSTYDGLGWENGVVLERLPIAADQHVPNLLLSDSLALEDGEPVLPRGRRLLTQDIFLSFNSRGLYGAAEPLSFSVDYRLDQRGVADQAAFWVDSSRESGGPGTSSFTVVSAIPAVNEAALLEEKAIQPDDEDPLWNELSRHLALPDTVTDRTRTLSAELTANLDSPYQKASAIETYLRELEYDLTVSKPPAEVVDVADYFIFDLQRGYCDYYATAFIVLARLAGLPARFATGFAVGSWSSADTMWVVTEAEAHSWPEVYFPSYGWIPFEPTAGRSTLSRIGVGPESNTIVAPSVSTPQPVNVIEEGEAVWNWQMLFWLLPIGLLLFGGYRLLIGWQRKRQAPWPFILRWGQRIGRPIAAGETVLEYGNGLSDFVLERYQTTNQDTGRRIARGITSLSEDLTVAQYGTTEQRGAASQSVDEEWRTLRSYVAQLTRFL